jgi:hypothetical protein
MSAYDKRFFMMRYTVWNKTDATESRLKNDYHGSELKSG